MQFMSSAVKAHPCLPKGSEGLSCLHNEHIQRRVSIRFGPVCNCPVQAMMLVSGGTCGTGSCGGQITFDC